MVGRRISTNRFRARVGAVGAFLAVVTAAVIGPSELSPAQAQGGDATVTFTANSTASAAVSMTGESALGTASLSRVAVDASVMAYDVAFQNRGRRVIGLRLHWASAGGPGGVVAVLDHRRGAEQTGGSVDFSGTFTSVVFTGPWTGISIAEFERRVASGNVVFGVATEAGSTRFVDYLPVKAGPTPSEFGETGISRATFSSGGDNSTMEYTVVFEKPGRRIIGLRLHWATSREPGGVVVVLDHRARSERPDGSVELTGTFTADAFTGGWNGTSIAELESKIADGRVATVVATENPSGGASADRAIDWLNASTIAPASMPTGLSATISVAEDVSSLVYKVTVPDLGSRIIGLRLQGRPGRGRGCVSTVAAVLNHQNQSVRSDGSIVIEGTFDGPWQQMKPTPTLEQIGRLYITVATEDDRLGSVCAPLNRRETLDVAFAQG